MKTKILTLAIASLMCIQLAKATTNIPPQLAWLTPATPSEATFDEEVVAINQYPVINFSMLAPEIPAEATFEDNMPEIRRIAPDLPTEATFEDNVPAEVESNYNYLAPSVPMEASFGELISNEPKTINIIYSFAPELPVEASFDDAVSGI